LPDGDPELRVIQPKKPGAHSVRFGLFCFFLRMKASFQLEKKQKSPPAFSGKAFSVVGVAGFEPATSCSQRVHTYVFHFSLIFYYTLVSRLTEFFIPRVLFYKV